MNCIYCDDEIPPYQEIPIGDTEWICSECNEKLK